MPKAAIPPARSRVLRLPDNPHIFV